MKFIITFLCLIKDELWAIIVPGSCQIPNLPPASKEFLRGQSSWHLDYLLPASSGATNPLFRPLAFNQNQLVYLEYPVMYVLHNSGRDCLILSGNMTIGEEVENDLQFSYKVQTKIGIGGRWAHGCFKYHVYLANIQVYHFNETLVGWMCTEIGTDHEVALMVLSQLNFKSISWDIFENENFPKVPLEQLIYFKKGRHRSPCADIECPKSPDVSNMLYLLIGILVMIVVSSISFIRQFYRRKVTVIPSRE